VVLHTAVQLCVNLAAVILLPRDAMLASAGMLLSSVGPSVRPASVCPPQSLFYGNDKTWDHANNAARVARD